MGVADPEVEQKPPKIFLPQKLKKNLILGRRDMNATVNCSFSKGLDEEKGPWILYSQCPILVLPSRLRLLLLGSFSARKHNDIMALQLLSLRREEGEFCQSHCCCAIIIRFFYRKSSRIIAWLLNKGRDTFKMKMIRTNARRIRRDAKSVKKYLQFIFLTSTQFTTQHIGANLNF